LTEWIVTREACNEQGLGREIKPRYADFPHYTVEIRFAPEGRVTLMTRKVEQGPGYAQEIEDLPPFLLEHVIALSVKMLSVLKSPKRLMDSDAFKEDGAVSDGRWVPEQLAHGGLDQRLVRESRERDPDWPEGFDPDFDPGGLEPEDYAAAIRPEAVQAALGAIAAASLQLESCRQCRHWTVVGQNPHGIPIGSCSSGRSPYSEGLITEREACDQFTVNPRLDEDAHGSNT